MTIGSSISHYKILDQLGEGGMGVVYRAKDTKLDRTVALKFLAAHLLNDDEAKQRFLREAKASAALDHPNICTVYEVDEAEGKTFLAMALLEGEALEDRIAQGPLPLKDALNIGRQVAEGLEAAHEKGIVHRDVKPANIMVDAKGRATIMDFGLARLTEASKLTRADQTVGTAAYMSPEQIQGLEVDQRTDIWALGCVLYEMVTGLRPFKGQYDQALAYEIVHEEPEPLTAVRAGVPMELEFIVSKCLAKETEARYADAGEIAKDLRTLGERLKSGRSTVVNASAVGSAHPGLPSRPNVGVSDTVLKRNFYWATGLAAVLAVVCSGLAILHFNQAPVERPVRTWAFSPAGLGRSSQTVVSPNGKYISYTTNRALWVRDLDQLEPRELAGTAGALRPFWSPDSAFIGFHQDGEIKKISVHGGAAVTLCSVPDGFYGGTWSPDGESIVFSSRAPKFAGLFEVPARGGQPSPLLERNEEADKGSANVLPHFLPPEAGARALLVTVGVQGETDVVVKNLKTGESLVLAGGARATYSPSGHIIYVSQDELWALPFSIDRLRSTGEAFPLGLASMSANVADDGTLISLRPPTSPTAQLVWRNRAGEKVGEIGQPQAGIRFPALSPDGRSVAVHSVQSRDIWVHEIDRPVKRRVTFDDDDESRPQWSPSGREITFASNRRGPYDIYRRAADGTGDVELLAGTKAGERPYGWSRDGNLLIYAKESNDGKVSDLWYLMRKDDGKGFEAVEFLSTPFLDQAPSLSPDGALLAYCSNQSGGVQVYVRPFPSGDGLLQVSTDGGRQPRWSSDGRELLYVEDGDTLMAVDVRKSPVLEAGAPTRLFSNPDLSIGPRSINYDVSADGRIVMVDTAADGRPDRAGAIDVIENWYEKFRDRE